MDVRCIIFGIFPEVGFTNSDKSFKRLLPKGVLVKFRLLSLVSRSDRPISLGLPLCIRWPFSRRRMILYMPSRLKLFRMCMLYVVVIPFIFFTVGIIPVGISCVIRKSSCFVGKTIFRNVSHINCYIDNITGMLVGAIIWRVFTWWVQTPSVLSPTEVGIIDARRITLHVLVICG